MRKIYGIGESLLDIIFKNGQPQTAKAGGSVLNCFVSLGRMELPATFISEYALDYAGNLIDSFLKDNGVDTSSVHRYDDGKTTLALAFLDEKNDAHYSFYQNYPSDRLKIKYPEVQKDDILLFGSFYSIWSEIREKFKGFILRAKEKGAIIIYDPNFRKSHLSDLNKLKPLIIDNMLMADIVRGSNEDFANLFGAGNVDEAYESVKPYCQRLVYTANVEGVYVVTLAFSGKFPVQVIKPISTIGAGDNFNAGMITSFFQNNIKKEDLSDLGEPEWSKVISMAVGFATNVCLSYDNYISVDFAGQMKKLTGK
jgi:fructokinase